MGENQINIETLTFVDIFEQVTKQFPLDHRFFEIQQAFKVFFFYSRHFLPKKLLNILCANKITNFPDSLP